MISWIPKTSSPSLKLLCLGAHSDDIEIGCGGTILRLLRERPGCDVRWIVFSASLKRRKEALAGAELFLKQAAKKRVQVLDFRDGFFPYQGMEIKQAFEKLKREFQPDVILTHQHKDLHQDHRTICDLAWNTYRNHLILEYEIPKYDGDMGAPNFFVRLSKTDARTKIDYLHRAFQSQAKKHWFTEDTFAALMRLRGMESNSESLFAEAFYARKFAF